MQEGLSTPEEDLEGKSHNSAPLYIIFVMMVTKASNMQITDRDVLRG